LLGEGGDVTTGQDMYQILGEETGRKPTGEVSDI